MAEGPCSPSCQQVSAHQVGVKDSAPSSREVGPGHNAFPQLPLLTVRAQLT